MPVRRAATRREILRRILLATDFIHTNYDKPLMLGDMARAAFLSRHHFLRLFKHIHDVTPHEYLQRKRTTVAARLLRGSDLAVEDIVKQVGFDSRSTLFRALRRFHGVTPRECRRAADSLVLHGERARRRPRPPETLAYDSSRCLIRSCWQLLVAARDRQRLLQSCESGFSLQPALNVLQRFVDASQAQVRCRAVLPRPPVALRDRDRLIAALQRALVFLQCGVAGAQIRIGRGAILLRDGGAETHLRELNAALPLAVMSASAPSASRTFGPMTVFELVAREIGRAWRTRRARRRSRGRREEARRRRTRS